MTALDVFFNAVACSNLPASVPIVTSDACGLGTVAFDIHTNEDALAVALSPDPRQRATAAIYACRASYPVLMKELTQT